MRTKVDEFDLESVLGGIGIDRYPDNTGVVQYNGQKYPYSSYSALLSVAQQCVNSGTYDDATLFAAFKAAGVI